jgi:hypothetical protein
MGSFYRSGLQVGILPSDIDAMTLEQLQAVLSAVNPDVIDGNAILTSDNREIALSFARQEGFTVAENR